LYSKKVPDAVLLLHQGRIIVVPPLFVAFLSAFSIR